MIVQIMHKSFYRLFILLSTRIKILQVSSKKMKHDFFFFLCKQYLDESSRIKDCSTHISIIEMTGDDGQRCPRFCFLYDG